MTRLKNWLERHRISREQKKAIDVQRFAHLHRNYLVIVCDPKDDSIFVSFRDKQVKGRISSADGRDHKVVRTMLKHSTFDKQIDRFLGGVMDATKIPLKEGNVFYSLLDGMLFNISKALKKH